MATITKKLKTHASSANVISKREVSVGNNNDIEQMYLGSFSAGYFICCMRVKRDSIFTVVSLSISQQRESHDRKGEHRWWSHNSSLTRSSYLAHLLHTHQVSTLFN